MVIQWPFMNQFWIESKSKSFDVFLFSDLTEDGPYGNVIGGSPWTDINTFKENGQLTAIQIRAGGAIDAIRARYSTTQLFVCFLDEFIDQKLSEHNGYQKNWTIVISLQF